MTHTPTSLRAAAQRFREEAQTIKDPELAVIGERLAKALDALADARERRAASLA